MSTNFGFGEEELLLRDSARRFFAEQLPPERLHRLVAADPDPERSPEPRWDPALWRQMAELGWTALGVPERAGGAGMAPVAAVALAEEAGRAALPAPLLPTLEASYLLAACGGTAADETLAEIVAGASATLALTDQRGSWLGEASGLELREGRLWGNAPYVQDAGKATLFVVKARSEEGLHLLLLRPDAAGLRVEPDAIVDLTRDQARLVCEGAVVARELAGPGVAERALEALEPTLYTLVAADLCGAAEWLLQTTAEYAQVRRQFDRPIGFFQAVKHPLVDVMMQIDQARSLLYQAASLLDRGPAQSLRAAHMAKAAASATAVYGAGRAVQLHGGIGFTWECQVQLWFKRQMHNQALFGDATWHRTRLAAMLFDAPAAGS